MDGIMILKNVCNWMLTLVVLMPLNLMANPKHAPENFKTDEGNAVFIDIKEAVYNLNYDSKKKSVTAVSKIHFETTEAGMPIFDLVEEPTLISLNGSIVQNKVINSPDKDAKFRLILKNINPGTHYLEISSPITKGVNFIFGGGIASAFWFSDLTDRSYLEAYLPTNYEFDQYKIIFNIDFKGLKKQTIYSNGKVSKLDDSQFKIEFPETYTTSSLYFHTAPIGRYNERRFNYHSIDGRDIPVIAYTTSKLGKKNTLDTLQNKITESLSGLESLYGPFLHQTLTVFNAGSGGMEYSGATMTSLEALNHELTHSYFARGGFMPANGNAGWIDEAITSWSDAGLPSNSDLGEMKSNMAGNSQYRRYTDIDAYTKGKSFISYLHYKFQANGGIASFLNQLIQTDSFKPMTTEELIKKISDYYSEDVTPLFKKYIYSQDSTVSPKKASGIHARRVHMKMSIDEMAQFL